MVKPTNFVIVYGALRSGTTLLRLMLDGHPKLDCPGEADFLFDFLSRAEDGSWALDTETLARERIYQNSKATVAPDTPAKEAVLDMIAQFHESEGSVVVLMIHRGLDKILDMFPDVQVLHMLRDPRDVARSSIGMGWAGTLFHGIGHWIGTEDQWHANVERIGSNKAETLQYEALIRDPEAELKRVVTFFGLTYSSKMLSYTESTTYAAPDVSLIEQWRSKLQGSDIALIEGRIGNLLQASGYEPSGHPPHHPRFPERLALAVKNTTSTWRTRIQRFGLIDPVLIMLARRLHMPGIGIKAQERLNTKMVAYLK